MIVGSRSRLGHMGHFGDSAGGIVSGVLSGMFDTIELRTSVTPPAVINLKTALAPSDQPSPITQFLQPTIILNGPGGQQVIAPYGQAGDGTAGTIGMIALLMGLGFGIGYYVRSKKR